MHICTVVGARPQFVKAAAVSPALSSAGIRETIIHTGQHYDANLSQDFFDQLGIPDPYRNLDVGSGPHGLQTSRMMERLEALLMETPRFDAMLLYGDTNSTLAGALVAAKMQLPIAHVEAGLRSFDRTMPEEINRVVADCLAYWRFAPTPTAVQNLTAEGLEAGTLLVGDVMLDATRLFSVRAADRMPLQNLTTHAPGQYAVATVHRASNTDTPGTVEDIFSALGQLPWPVLMPLHPRTRAKIDHVQIPGNVELQTPVSYLAMLTLVRHARCVLTDSGGLQKEAYWMQVPCVTLRTETEWPETCINQWNTCTGTDPSAIVDAAVTRPSGPQKPFGRPPQGGSAASAIAQALLSDPEAG